MASDTRSGTERPQERVSEDPMAEIRALLPDEIAKGHRCATCGAPAVAHKIRGGFCPWMPAYKAPETQP